MIPQYRVGVVKAKVFATPFFNYFIMNLPPESLKNRERLRKLGDLESLRALARTTFQEKSLEDFSHFVGKTVSVVWNMTSVVFDETSELVSTWNKKEKVVKPLYDCPDWENQVVVNVVRFGCGEIMAELDRTGPERFVRVERLKENT